MTDEDVIQKAREVMESTRSSSNDSAMEQRIIDAVLQRIGFSVNPPHTSQCFGGQIALNVLTGIGGPNSSSGSGTDEDGEPVDPTLVPTSRIRLRYVLNGELKEGNFLLGPEDEEEPEPEE